MLSSCWGPFCGNFPGCATTTACRCIGYAEVPPECELHGDLQRGEGCDPHCPRQGPLEACGEVPRHAGCPRKQSPLHTSSPWAQHARSLQTQCSPSSLPLSRRPQRRVPIPTGTPTSRHSTSTSMVSRLWSSHTSMTHHLQAPLRTSAPCPTMSWGP